LWGTSVVARRREFCEGAHCVQLTGHTGNRGRTDRACSAEHLAHTLRVVAATHVMSRRKAPSLDEVATVFDALSHEVRRHIVQLLAHYGPELSSGYLAKRFSHSWPTTTRHLHVLEAAGIVTVRRDGRNCVYRLEREHLQRVVGGWLGLLERSATKELWRSPGRRSVTKGSVS
jgi:DNA-binding transcriptional ArsR family regulator